MSLAWALRRVGRVCCAVVLAKSAWLAAGASARAEPEGEKLFKAKLCTTCHGSNGTTALQPTYPKLAGQNAAYLVAQTLDIMSGKRTNGQAALMKATTSVVKLTETELKTIADWLAQQK